MKSMLCGFFWKYSCDLKVFTKHAKIQNLQLNNNLKTQRNYILLSALVFDTFFNWPHFSFAFILQIWELGSEKILKHKLFKVAHKLIIQLEWEVIAATFTLQIMVCLTTLGHYVILLSLFHIPRKETISELWNVSSFSLLTNFPKTNMLKIIYHIHILPSVSKAKEKEILGHWLSQKHRNKPLVKVKQEQVGKWSKQFIFVLAFFYIYLPFSLTLPALNCAYLRKFLQRYTSVQWNLLLPFWWTFC